MTITVFELCGVNQKNELCFNFHFYRQCVNNPCTQTANSFSILKYKITDKFLFIFQFLTGVLTIK